MGIGAIKSALQHWHDKYAEVEVENTSTRLTVTQGFMQGLYTNLLNPKAMIFFITLFSVMVPPAETTATKIAIAMILLSLSLLWFVFIALVLSKPNVQQKVRELTPVINVITGLLFVSVAIAIVSGLIYST